MPRHRLAASLLLSLGTALLGVLSFPAAASAARDTITITSAGNPASDVGPLSVNATATTPITSITVHLLSGRSPLLTVSGFNYPRNQKSGTWTLQTPITEGHGPGQLPLGSYTISVTAKEAGGGSASEQDAGTLNFLSEPAIGLSATPTEVDYDNPQVAFSGTVMTLAPGGTPQPLGDYPIELNNEENRLSYPITTNDDGSYSYSLPQADPASYIGEVQATPTTAQAMSPPVLISVNLDPVQVTAQLSATKVNYGQPVTLTGTVTYTPQDAADPIALPNGTVSIYNGSTSTHPVALTMTNGSGQFSVVLPATPTATWIVTAGGGIYLDLAKVSLPLDVIQPTAISPFTVRLSQYGVLSVAGCLKVRDDPAGRLPAHPAIVIQYSAGANGPWKSLGNIRAVDEFGGCGTSAGDVSFNGTLTARLASAYYRAKFGGTSAFQPSVSSPLLRWKYLSEITSFSVSPRSTHVTVT